MISLAEDVDHNYGAHDSALYYYCNVTLLSEGAHYSTSSSFMVEGPEPGAEALTPGPACLSPPPGAAGGAPDLPASPGTLAETCDLTLSWATSRFCSSSL